VTIVTDNLPYGESLIRALAKTAHEGLVRRSQGGVGVAFVSSPPPETGKRTLQESVSVSLAAGPSSDKGRKGATAEVESDARMRDSDEEEDEEDDDDDEEDGQRGFNKGRDGRKSGHSTPSVAAKQQHTPSNTGPSKGKVDPTSSGALNLELWRGESEESGPGGRVSSSYFDRLWARGQKKRRWFIVLRKL
jgi:hypothetical protein